MSSLKSRLNTLRQQGGAATAPALPASAGGSSFADQVARLMPRSTAAGRGAVVRDEAALAERLGAQRLAEGLLLVDRHIPLGHYHGSVQLQRLSNPLSRFVESADGLLFMDTETTGLSGGVGTTVFMLGLARLGADGLHTRQYLLTAFAGERAMLASAAEWFGEAKTMLSYNGKSFDCPLLNARYRLTGLADPLRSLPHVDLLHPLRRAFASRWPDCRLASVERRLLGFERVDDLSGAEAPAAWFDWLHRGDGGRLGAVLEHNRLDLLSLAALLPVLDGVYRKPTAHGADLAAIARHHERGGEEALAHALLRDNEGLLDDDGLRDLARLHRRAGRWEEARRLWEVLSGRGCADSTERLAKYHEHVRRDLPMALRWASSLPVTGERERRIERLRQRLQMRPSERLL